MQMTGGFDASTVAPDQGGSKHPVGSFPFTITNTSIESSKDQKSGMFIIEFTSPAGVIVKRYNLWHDNPQTVEIAQKQLSALCHATGIFKLDWTNQGAALRGARGTMEVVNQTKKNAEGKYEETGYVEVKKVYDAAGNEPGKPAQQAAPMQQQPNGGWTQPQQPQQQQGNWANPPAQQGWQPPQQQQAPFTAPSGPNTAPQNAPGQMPQQGQAAMPGPAQGGWQQQPQQNPIGNAPPWAGNR